MIQRRLFLAGAAALATVSRAAWAEASRISLAGAMEQGSLVVGKTDSGTRITIDENPVRVSPQGLFAFGFDYNQVRPTAIAARCATTKSSASTACPRNS